VRYLLVAEHHASGQLQSPESARNTTCHTHVPIPSQYVGLSSKSSNHMHVSKAGFIQLHAKSRARSAK
jgi:hypothetical protein